jgi:hypothetical protein
MLSLIFSLVFLLISVVLIVIGFITYYVKNKIIEKKSDSIAVIVSGFTLLIITLVLSVT